MNLIFTIQELKMKTITTIIRDTKKKAFTLIELLIVVAIIGILAGVGVPMYNGYMANAKIESARTNHKNITTFIASSSTQCASGVRDVVIGATARSCQRTPAQFAGWYIAYFDAVNSNPETSILPSTVAVAPTIGQTQITSGTGPDRIMVMTNVGMVNGTATNLPATGVDTIIME